MANAAIAYRNLADTGTITASSAEAEMPASRLQNEHVGKRWRSTSEPANFTLDLGGNTALDTIALLGMTVGSATTVRVRVSTSSGGSTAGDLHDATYSAANAQFNPDYGMLVVPLATPVSGRYVRIDITDTPASYVEAGRLFVGLREAFTYNFAPGAGIRWEDRSRKTESAGGQTLIFADNKFRVAELNFEWVTETQRWGLVEQIDRLNGQSVDVLLCLDTEADDLPAVTIFGLINAPAANLYTNLTGIFARAYQVKERL